MLEGTYRAGHCLCELCSGWVVKASRFLLKDDLEQTLQECVDDILREIRQEEQVVEFGFPAKAHGAVCHAGGWGIFRRGNG